MVHFNHFFYQDFTSSKESFELNPSRKERKCIHERRRKNATYQMKLLKYQKCVDHLLFGSWYLKYTLVHNHHWYDFFPFSFQYLPLLLLHWWLFCIFHQINFISNIFFRIFFFECFFFQNVARTELIAISFVRFVYYWVSIDQIRTSFNLFILYSL